MLACESYVSANSMQSHASDHIAELNNPRPRHPFFFLKPATSILAPKTGPVRRPRGVKLHYEVELALIMGRELHQLNENDASGALDAIEGYAVAVDMTARNVQDECKRKGLPWTSAKGFDTFLPISNFIPKDRIPDPHDVGLWLDVDEKRKQDDNSGLMLFRIPRLLSEICRVMRLEKGDVICTGTPKGVGEINTGETMRAGLTIRNKQVEEARIEVTVEDDRGQYVYEET